MQRCAKCNSLMPDDVTRCVRCGFDRKELRPTATARPSKPSPLPPPSQPAASQQRSRLTRFAWPIWWCAFVLSATFLVLPPYVLRILPRARTAILVAFALVLAIGCAALVLGIVRTAKTSKLKAALLGLVAAVPQVFFVIALAQIVMVHPDANLGVICKAGDCVSVAEAAEQGNPDAQFAMAMAYHTGRGRAQNDAIAAEWLERAARGGHTKSQAYYGLTLYRGIGVPANRAEAVKWLAKAADAGDEEAESTLGIAYYEGGGVPANFSESEKWWRRAGMQGNVEAEANIGVLYFEGRGVAKNEDEALKWLTAAAEAGDRGALDYIAKLGYRWPDDKSKIDERLASSKNIVQIPEVPSAKTLEWRAEQRAKAEALMAKGADAFDDGRTALCYAVEAADIALVQALLDKGADPNGRERDDAWAPIHAAAASGSPEIAALLIDHGAKVDLRSEGVPEPIQLAVGRDNNAVVALLLDHGADANSVRLSGSGTLLHEAATHSDNRELVELLLKHGANPNARDGDARTPLHIAASNTEARTVPAPLGKIPSRTFARKLEIVQALLKGGADPSLRDVSGKTAADYAKLAREDREESPAARARFEPIIAALRSGK